MSPEGPARLRVAVLGLEGNDGSLVANLVTALAGRGVEVKPAGGVDGLLDGGVDLGVIFGSAEAGANVLRAAAARSSKAPALALFLGDDAGDHPHTHLLRVLVDAKNEWEQAFDAIVDPVMLLEADGRVARANRELAHVLGMPIVDTVGGHYRDLLGAATRSNDDTSGDPIGDSLADGRPRTREASYERLSGTQEVTTSPLYAPGGAPRGLVVHIKDVTERKEQQHRLLRASRLADIGQLAAGVAHEINTPLASIALRAESLLKSAEDQRLRAIDVFDKFPRYLKTIDEEIFRCKKIIGSLLDFSRARKPEARQTDLNALVQEAADLVRHQMKLKQLTLSESLDPRLPKIVADDGQIRQALLALLMNALDATPPGGTVTVETRREGDGLVALSVRDTGAGIPPEHRDKVFSPFFTTKPVGQGTGLGLAICHGIVASHGGEIRVDSEVDKGTLLTLVLPLGHHPAGAPAAGP